MASFAFTFQQALGLGRLPLSKRLSPFATTVQKSSSSSPSFHRAQRRSYSEQIADGVEPPEYLQEGERKIFDKIRDELRPTQLEVQDISGGCGSMYALDIVAEQFKGMPVIKQHRLVNKILEAEMKTWHGVQLKTRAP